MRLPFPFLPLSGCDRLACFAASSRWHQMVVLGDMSLGGSVTPVESLAECLQVAFDAGAKKVALPMSSAADIPTIPAELFTKFQTSFYADPVDAVFKALGVD